MDIREHRAERSERKLGKSVEQRKAIADTLVMVGRQLPEPGDHTVRFKDLTGPARSDRDGSDLVSRGLYLDLLPWGHHVSEVTAA